MKHGKKLLLVVAIICAIVGTGCAAWMSVIAFQQGNPQKGAGMEAWREDTEPEAEALDEEAEEDIPDSIVSDTEEEDSDSSEEDQMMYGMMEGNCYSNEWFHFKMELPENYIVLSSDEFDYAQGIGADQFMTEEGQDQLEAAKNYGNVKYVMAAYEENGSMSVNIAIERLLSKNITMEQYLRLAQKSLESTMSDNLTLSFEGITEETIGEEIYHCIHERIAYGGAGETCMDQYVRIEDGYVMVMSVGYSEEAAAQKDEFLSSIQAY